MNSKIKCVLGILLVATIILGMTYLFGDNHSNNISEINNATDFEVPSNFEECYKLKDNSFVKYRGHGDHLITIDELEGDKDYRLWFGSDDDCEIIKTNVSNIYKRWIGGVLDSQTDFVEMIKVNNKTYGVSILDTSQIAIFYDPDSLQNELAEFNELNNIKPLKLNKID